MPFVAAFGVHINLDIQKFMHLLPLDHRLPLPFLCDLQASPSTFSSFSRHSASWDKQTANPTRPHVRALCPAIVFASTYPSPGKESLSERHICALFLLLFAEKLSTPCRVHRSFTSLFPVRLLPIGRSTPTKHLRLDSSRPTPLHTWAHSICRRGR